MKKLFAVLALSGFIACNDSATDDTATTVDTIAPVTAPATVDTPAVSTNATMKDGVMTLKDGKMMVMKAGNWEAMTEAVTTSNGRKVSLTGEVSKGDRKRMLTEGQMIDKDGQMMDKDGTMMDNTGWE